MRDLMAHSVAVWESDPEAFSYHPVGYMQISPEVMHEDVASIYKQQKEIGYPSDFIEGEKRLHDLHAGPVLRLAGRRASPRSCTRRRAATPTTRARIYGLAKKAENEGVRIVTGVKVTGFEQGRLGRGHGGGHRQGQDRLRPGGRRRRPVGQADLGHAGTAQGRSRSRAATARCTTTCRCGPSGRCRRARSASIPSCRRTNDGKMPPVIHVDTDAPLVLRCRRLADHRQAVGHLLQAGLPFRRRAGRRDAATRSRPTPDAGRRSIRTAPRARTSSSATISPICGARRWPSARSASKAPVPKYKKEPSGGIGCFTAGQFPGVRRFCENVYVIADSNHGYKMIGVGKLVADEICGRRERAAASRSASRRYAEGKLHPVSNSPFPWS